jgi:hypothetical protein
VLLCLIAVVVNFVPSQNIGTLDRTSPCMSMIWNLESFKGLRFALPREVLIELDEVIWVTWIGRRMIRQVYITMTMASAQRLTFNLTFTEFQDPAPGLSK